ncbi:ATP-binding cassette domain-containing protein [Microbacterium sp. JZ70]
MGESVRMRRGAHTVPVDTGALRLSPPVLRADVRVDRSRALALNARIELHHGEVVAVMGPRGSGASTLLAALAGTIRLSDGSIELDAGIRIDRRRHLRPARRGIALVAGAPDLPEHLRLRDIVADGLRHRGVPRGLARQEADEWLWHVGLPGAGDHHPRELSAGGRVRVAVARALAAAPRVLLLDDPLARLDAREADDVRQMLREQLAATLTTALVVTRELVDAVALAQRMVVLERGRVTQSDRIPAVLAAPATAYVAEIAGLNRLEGVFADGHWTPRESAPGPRLASSHRTHVAEGAPAAAIFPMRSVRVEHTAERTWTGAVRVAGDSPASPGRWLSRVARIEPLPAGGRVRTSAPEIAVDLTSARLAELRLQRDDPIWLSVDPSDVRVRPA